MQLVAQMPHGPAPFLIVELSDETVTADFNHALAGKALTFSVEVVDLRKASEEGSAMATHTDPVAYNTEEGES